MLAYLRLIIYITTQNQQERPQLPSHKNDLDRAFSSAQHVLSLPSAQGPSLARSTNKKAYMHFLVYGTPVEGFLFVVFKRRGSLEL